MSDLGYLCARGDGRLRYDNPAFSIVWPLRVTVISSRDLDWPPFDPQNTIFPAQNASASPSGSLQPMAAQSYNRKKCLFRKPAPSELTRKVAIDSVDLPLQLRTGQRYKKSRITGLPRSPSYFGISYSSTRWSAIGVVSKLGDQPMVLVGITQPVRQH